MPADVALSFFAGLSALNGCDLMSKGRSGIVYRSAIADILDKERGSLSLNPVMTGTVLAKEVAVTGLFPACALLNLYCGCGTTVLLFFFIYLLFII